MDEKIQIITTTITREDVRRFAEQRFGDLVKAVVDIELNRMALGGELHADEERLLIERGSKQENLWGINLYPDVEGDAWIEFDSMINVRPRMNNRSRSVEDVTRQKRIIEVVNTVVK